MWLKRYEQCLDCLFGICEKKGKRKHSKYICRENLSCFWANFYLMRKNMHDEFSVVKIYGNFLGLFLSVSMFRLVYKFIVNPLISIVRSFSKPRWRRRQERHQTKDLMSKTIAVHVRFESWYISLPYSAKQQREITKFYVFLLLELNSAGAHLVWASF